MMQNNFDIILQQVASNNPAPETSIASLEMTIGISLPIEYRDFLKITNGFEGFLANNRYLILWPIEQIAELNEAYNVAEFAPGLLLIGSDGGDTGYGFDTRSDPMKICETPFVGMSHQTMNSVGISFNQFINQL